MKKFNKNRIIAAVRTETELVCALKSGVEMIFYLTPDLHTLENVVKSVHKHGKKLMIHLDLATGIGKDKSGIMYVKNVGVDGIISTRVNIIKTARECGLFAVQRFFIVDSHSVVTTVETVKASKADMIEIMPGTVSKVIKKLKKDLDMPIVAGGLIETEEEMLDAMTCGATAISTGKREFW